MKKTFVAVAALLLGQASPAFSQENKFFDDFDDGVLSDVIYKVRTSNENSTIIVDNGMLRLEAASDGGAPGRAALDFVEQTDFIQAEFKLDSTSMAEGTGVSRVSLSGTLYNERKPEGITDEGSLGDVLVQLSLRLKGDGTLDNIVCAFSSNDSDFGDITTVAIDGFDACGRFDTEIQMGVLYKASIFLDRANRKLVFTLNDSTIEHLIRGNMFEPTPTAVSSVLAQANGIGRAVAYADNVSNSAEAAAAEDSTETDPVADPETDPIADPETDPAADPETDPATDPETDPAADPETDPAVDPETDPAVDPTVDPEADTTVEEPANDASVDNDSSSGCSIAGTSASNDPMFPILSALALVVLGLRRSSLRNLLSKSNVTEKTSAAV